MEDPDADYDNQPYSTEGTSGEECGMLNKGLTLGKRILLTGFVLSSAPVVIPPLAIVSAFSVAVSIPFGLYLASYSCTEKLMSKLLSTPLTYPSLLDYDNVAYDEEEFSSERGEEKDGVFASEKDEEEWIEDTLGHVEMRLELGENGVGSKQETEEETEKGYEENVVGDIVIENLPESTEVPRPKEEEERVREESREGEPQLVYGAVVTVIEGDERKLSDPKEAIDFPIEVTTVVGGSTSLPTETRAGVDDDFKRETTELIEKIRDEGRSDELAEDGKKSNISASGESTDVDNISREEHKRTAEREALRRGAGEIGDGSGLQLSDAKTEGTQEPTEKGYDSRQEYGQNQSNLGKESADISEIPVSTNMPTSGEAMNVSLDKDDASMSEEIFSEERIWQRINAMKIIVGYKAEPRPTCLEELRALYVFTGVEPPASFNDASDFAEINDRLQFLMSIVGVK